jgi:2-methylcitrate dehydratase PrpD
MNPEIRSFLPKIKVEADPEFEKTFPELKQSGAEIKTKDGREVKLIVDYPLGDYREPMDDRTLMAKFDSMVIPLVGQTKRDQIVDSIMNIDREKDVSNFMRVLAK